MFRLFSCVATSVFGELEGDILLQSKKVDYSPRYETTGTPVPYYEDDCSVVVTDEDGCVSVVNYGDNERCTFNMQALPLHVVHFDIERCCDKLTVNGRKYSGREGPEGVTPNGPLVWFSDHEISGSSSQHDTEPSHDTGGFKICPVGRPVETTDSPTWNPPDTTGPPHYETTWNPTTDNPNIYQSCEGGPICASGQTDRHTDWQEVSVEGECCCPVGKRPGDDEGFWWQCHLDWNPSDTTGPPHYEDDCSMVVTDEDGCVSVVNHGDNERCTFNMQALPLRVVQFDTEQCCDKLTVNGREYSGRQGPEGVTPHGPLVWYSDHSESGSQSHSSHDTGGFKICPDGRPVETTDSPPPEEETTSLTPVETIEEVWHVEATITKVAR